MLEKNLILTIDLDAFFAQAETLKHPEYKKIPIAVGNEIKGRGIVSTANYKAREYGVKSGMPLFKAKELCSELKVVPVDFEYYQQKANEVFNVISKFSNKIEFASIDECYIDVTSMVDKYKPIEIAKLIYFEVLNKTNLTVSIGISTNVLLSKVASNFNKPSGISTLFKHEIEDKLWPLPVSSLYMVGNKTSEKLIENNINTIKDLALLKNNQEKYHLLKQKMGIFLDKIIDSANGYSRSELNMKERELKSISKDKTYGTSITDSDTLRYKALELFEFALYRSERRKMYPTTITVALKKDKSFNRSSSSKKLKEPTLDRDILWSEIDNALDKLFVNGDSIKFISISFDGLKPLERVYKQLSIGEKLNAKNKLDSIAKDINIKSGSNLVTGSVMKDNRRFEYNDPIDSDNVKFKSWDKS